MSVLTDIKNRGTEDILIACMDGLTGFPDAVKAVCRDLKEVYNSEDYVFFTYVRYIQCSTL